MKAVKNDDMTILNFSFKFVLLYIFYFCSLTLKTVKNAIKQSENIQIKFNLHFTKNNF